MATRICITEPTGWSQPEWSAAGRHPASAVGPAAPGGGPPVRAGGDLRLTCRDHLVSRYGGEATDVLALLRDEPRWAERLVPGLPYRVVEVIHAARREMAMTVDDVLARRTRVMAPDADAARSVSCRAA